MTGHLHDFLYAPVMMVFLLISIETVCCLGCEFRKHINRTFSPSSRKSSREKATDLSLVLKATWEKKCRHGTYQEVPEDKNIRHGGMQTQVRACKKTSQNEVTTFQDVPVSKTMNSSFPFGSLHGSLASLQQNSAVSSCPRQSLVNPSNRTI